ncbi:hypothetical protein QW131_06045 [Roseibium salinum]|nr:hypothetical protein [Roseibium salinum]
MCLALILTAPLSGPANAGIRVIVNDTPITDYDISQRARLITLTQKNRLPLQKREAEEELVDDHVKLAEAERVGISVGQSEIDNAFNNIARNVKNVAVATFLRSASGRRPAGNPESPSEGSTGVEPGSELPLQRQDRSR